MMHSTILGLDGQFAFSEDLSFNHDILATIIEKLYQIRPQSEDIPAQPALCDQIKPGLIEDLRKLFSLHTPKAAALLSREDQAIVTICDDHEVLQLGIQLL